MVIWGVVKYKLRRRYLYYLLRIVSLISLIFPIKINKFLGRRIGEYAYFIAAKHRNKALENLRLAYGNEKSEGEIRQIARGVFRNLGENFFEILCITKFTPQNIDKYIKVDGFERLERALSQRRGFIVLTGHFGNWELLAGYFGLRGYPVTVLARRLRFEKFDKFINALRKKLNVKVIMRDESAKVILRMLKEGNPIAMLVDQDIDSIDGVFVDFFGHPAYTPIAPVALALATAVPIIPMFIMRERSGHRIFVEEPLELEITGNKEMDIKANTEKWSKIVESYIRKDPSQWVWMHDRWSTKSE